MLNGDKLSRIGWSRPFFVTAKSAADKPLFHRDATSSIARHTGVVARIFV
jgi:hypothetical protein